VNPATLTRAAKERLDLCGSLCYGGGLCFLGTGLGWVCLRSVYKSVEASW
jgi:hypothetical protein